MQYLIAFAAVVAMVVLAVAAHDEWDERHRVPTRIQGWTPTAYAPPARTGVDLRHIDADDMIVFIAEAD
ncbi:hypothetical protein [Streptomyces boncukensis]|uniref:Uncharacterized protein n=1 Tax=Streptomyces boncukensis TaxID=2711219 RepID=A0A6G4X6D5_9ACTN|nr:hypothetical protein [Streptomyces boncukensis]NGO72813.1 hypothetical protein [Streptomyces boncukensis]